MGFSTRLGLIVTTLVLIFIAASVLLAVVSYNTALRDLRAANAEAARLFLINQAEQIAMSRSRSLAQNLINQIYFWRLDQIRNLLETEQTMPTTSYVHLTNKHGKIIADGKNSLGLIGHEVKEDRILKVLNGGPTAAWMDADTLHVASAIKLDNEILGAVITGTMLKEIKAKIAVSKTYMGWISDNSKHLFFSGLLAMTAILAIISVVLAFVISRTTTLPIRRLAEVTRAIGEGKYDTSGLPDRKDELGDLANALRDAAEHRKEAEGQLLAAKEAAESASRMKSQFLMTVSHELRTPLHPIIGFSETLAANMNQMDQEKVVEALNIINTSGHQLNGIVNDVLDLARFEAGQVDMSPSKIKVSEILIDLEDQLRYLMRKTGNTLTTDCSEDTGAITSDEVKLKQILANLIDNAAKFTDHGKIEVRAFRRNNSIMFEVEDEGVGIDPTKLDMIFEPFVQINASYNRNQYGSGLGLAIVKRYCELLNGTVSATSAKGQGACFTVEIPDLDSPKAGT